MTFAPLSRAWSAADAPAPPKPTTTTSACSSQWAASASSMVSGDIKLLPHRASAPPLGDPLELAADGHPERPRRCEILQVANRGLHPRSVVAGIEHVPRPELDPILLVHHAPGE